MAPSCSAVRIIIVLILSVGFMLFSSVFFVLWKLKENIGKFKKNKIKLLIPKCQQQSFFTVLAWVFPQHKYTIFFSLSFLTGERETLLKMDEDMAELCEKLQEKREEKNDLLNVISVFMELKNKLKISTEKETIEDIVRRMTKIKEKVSNQIEQISKQVEEIEKQKEEMTARGVREKRKISVKHRP